MKVPDFSKKVAFIVSEYNPLHNGHIYHIQKTREMTGADFVVAVMSGYFTQRGDVACMPFPVRAECAIRNGIDAVLTLPVFFSTASADYFALGAMKVIQALNIPGTISFGAEHDAVQMLTDIAGALHTHEEEYYSIVRNELKKGIPYVKAREIAVRSFLQVPEGILERSNNILGIEYIKNAMKLQLPVTFTAVKRIGADYNDISEQPVMSASGIRANISENHDAWKNSVPADVAGSLEQNRFRSIENALPFIVYTVAREGTDIRRYRDVNEGLENRIINALRTTKNWKECVASVKSKRYTETHIRRALTAILLGITKNEFNEAVTVNLPFVEIAGLNDHGKAFIRSLSGYTQTPLVHSVGKYPWKDFCAPQVSVALYSSAEIRSRKVYDLL